MSQKEMLKFAEICIEKRNCNILKGPIDINNVNIENIVLSKKCSFGKKLFSGLR